jgi:hypothetical protein
MKIIVVGAGQLGCKQLVIKIWVTNIIATFFRHNFNMTNFNGEMGLLSFALPNYANNRYFVVYYNTANGI